MGNGVLGLGLGVVIQRKPKETDRKGLAVSGYVKRGWERRKGQAAASMDDSLACVIYIGSRGMVDIDTLRYYSA